MNTCCSNTFHLFSCCFYVVRVKKQQVHKENLDHFRIPKSARQKLWIFDGPSLSHKDCKHQLPSTQKGKAGKGQKMNGSYGSPPSDTYFTKLNVFQLIVTNLKKRI